VFLDRLSARLRLQGSRCRGDELERFIRQVLRGCARQPMTRFGGRLRPAGARRRTRHPSGRGLIDRRAAPIDPWRADEICSPPVNSFGSFPTLAAIRRARPL
jgi:hypothetical protein